MFAALHLLIPLDEEAAKFWMTVHCWCQTRQQVLLLSWPEKERALIYFELIVVYPVRYILISFILLHVIFQFSYIYFRGSPCSSVCSWFLCCIFTINRGVGLPLGFQFCYIAMYLFLFTCHVVLIIPIIFILFLWRIPFKCLLNLYIAMGMIVILTVWILLPKSREYLPFSISFRDVLWFSLYWFFTSFVRFTSRYLHFCCDHGIIFFLFQFIVCM